MGYLFREKLHKYTGIKIVEGYNIASKLPSTDKIPYFDSVQSLYKWTVNNVKYGWIDDKMKIHISDDIDENIYYATVRMYPAEVTYEVKIGTCFEQSVFILSVMLRDLSKLRPVMWHIQTSDREGKEQDISNHALVMFNENNKYYWIETAWLVHRNIHGPFRSVKQTKQKVEQYIQTTHPTGGVVDCRWSEVPADDVVGKILTPDQFHDIIHHH